MCVQSIRRRCNPIVCLYCNVRVRWETSEMSAGHCSSTCCPPHSFHPIVVAVRNNQQIIYIFFLPHRLEPHKFNWIRMICMIRMHAGPDQYVALCYEINIHIEYPIGLASPAMLERSSNNDRFNKKNHLTSIETGLYYNNSARARTHSHTESEKERRKRRIIFDNILQVDLDLDRCLYLHLYRFLCICSISFLIFVSVHFVCVSIELPFELCALS